MLKCSNSAFFGGSGSRQSIPADHCLCNYITFRNADIGALAMMAGGTVNAHELCGALRRGMCLMGCCFLLDGCAASTPPPPPVEEAQVEHVYVLGPSSLMLYLDSKNPPLLGSEGLDENLPVFASLHEAQQWLQTEEAEKRLVTGLWQVYILEGSWKTDVTQAPCGEPRMRHPARIYPLI